VIGGKTYLPILPAGQVSCDRTTLVAKRVACSSFQTYSRGTLLWVRIVRQNRTKVTRRGLCDGLRCDIKTDITVRHDNTNILCCISLCCS
jgi:hypothetical protein